MRMQAAIQPYHRRGDLEDGERARGLSVRGLRDRSTSRPGTPGSRASPPTGRTACSARCSRSSRRRAAGPRPVRARPAHPHRRRAAGGAGGAALAAPAEARRRLAVLDLHGRGAGQPLRGLRRPRRERRPPPVRGLGQRRADPARPRGAGQEPLDGHARPGPRLAEAEARQPGQDARARPFTVAMPPDGRPVPVAGNVSAFAKVVEHRCEALGVFDGDGGRDAARRRDVLAQGAEVRRRRHALAGPSTS